MKQVLFIFLIIYLNNALAQVKVNSKLYVKDLKEADILFESEDYLKAIKSYNKVVSIDPLHEIANLNLAISKLKLNYPVDSIYTNLIKLSKSKVPEVQFYFGKISHLSSNFDEAINYYTKYKSMPEKQRKITNQEVDYYLSCSKNAKEFTNAPHRSIIKNLGNKVNSIYDDYVPLLFPDENYLFFTSRRAGITCNLKDVYDNYY